MIKITNNFAIIGTNPEKYFRNYCNFLNGISLGEVITINWEKLQVEYQNKILIEFHSDATLRQNIDAWLCFGFIDKKNNNDFVKIVKWNSDENLYEIVKTNLLKYSEDKKILKHRNTILLKILFLHKPELLTNKEFYSGTNQKVDYQKIKQEIGKFENILANDQEFVKIVELLGEKFYEDYR